MDEPKASSLSPKTIARCYSQWPDFDEALAFLTPGGRGEWGSVVFVQDDNAAPDWHVIFNYPPTEIEIEAPANRVIFAVGEPPVMAFRPLHLGQGPGTIVMTSEEALAKRRSPPRRYRIEPCMTRSWSVKKTLDELRRPQALQKPKRLSWVTSSKATLAGHRYRLEFLRRLRERIDLDLYGRGFAPIEDKWQALAPYRYSIAFENAAAPYYFTEKIMDCFVAETVPLYFGSPWIGRFFPEEALIVIDPGDPDVFDKIAEVVASDLYRRNRDAIIEAKRRTLEIYNIFARLALFMTETTEEPSPPVRMKFKATNMTFPIYP
jgi:Glycosyltransferase family 10 (fucosyltransferase) C-term